MHTENNMEPSHCSICGKELTMSMRKEYKYCCASCGEKFASDIVLDEVACPHCESVNISDDRGEANYCDSRTPEERANEPKSTLTTATAIDEATTCHCKEMSCKEGCTRNHTHKGFFCEKCEPGGGNVPPYQLPPITQEIQNNSQANITPKLHRDEGEVQTFKTATPEYVSSLCGDEVQTGWEKKFIATWYCYNLKTGTPAGAEKEAVAFIKSLLKEQVERIRKEVEGMKGIYDENGLQTQWVQKSEVLLILASLTTEDKTKEI